MPSEYLIPRGIGLRSSSLLSAKPYRDVGMKGVRAWELGDWGLIPEPSLPNPEPLYPSLLRVAEDT
jgi:hypothetical protein